VLPRALALETSRALPGFRFVEVPGNHMTMLFGSHADLVVRVLSDFISGGAEPRPHL
jgi:hypothetical protein